MTALYLPRLTLKGSAAMRADLRFRVFNDTATVAAIGFLFQFYALRGVDVFDNPRPLPFGQWRFIGVLIP